MREFLTVIAENDEIKPGIFSLWLTAESPFVMIPGQFMNIYLERPDMLLPRPISLCDREGGAIRLVYRIAGKGTDYLSRLQKGNRLRVAGPLGNGFTAAEDGKALLIGGGIGVPPLLLLAKKIKSARIFLGFRSASSAILAGEFASLGCETDITTDDGSMGYKGDVMEAVKAVVRVKDIARIYACGPKIMLKGVAEYAARNQIPCQVSMEERMGCGIGACLCCPVPVMENGARTYKKLCMDGPVFEAGAILWEGA